MQQENSSQLNSAQHPHTGRKMIAATSSSAPWTAIPTNLKGSKNSQTIGYGTAAISASGQQITTKKAQHTHLP